MHSDFTSLSNVIPRRSAPVVMFALLAIAAAPPSHAAKSWGNWGGSAPTISGSPPTTVSAGQPYSFRPTAADIDGDKLSFRVGNLPSWASYDRATGQISGTPGAANVGKYLNVTVRVTDGRYWTSLPAFNITVTQPTVVAPTTTNRAPTISGTPVTSARVDPPYAFKPTALDPDGDQLVYSIKGKPAWATFDMAEGTLYGVPTAADVNSTASVVISVSDGTTAASLPAFSLSVAPAPTTAVRLSWQPPAYNVDGTPVTDLAGYRVLYGTAPGSYTYSLPVSSPTVTSVVIEGLTPATTWYFVAKAVSASGVESDYSPAVSKAL
jgi:Putative Ig domain/Fibronectin type III domain